MVTILILTILLLGIAIFLFFSILKPYEKLRFDETVHYTGKYKVGLTLILNILTFIGVGYLIFIIHRSRMGYQKLGETITNNKEFNSAFHHLDSHVSQTTLLHISYSFMLGLCIAMLLTVVIFLIIMNNISRLISTMIAYKQQKNNSRINKLFIGIKKDKRHEVINAYFEMKENKDKHPLFITQWRDIVSMLLLEGYIEEAETLNRYIAEREKYCGYVYRLFQSRDKVSLYDYDGLKSDKNKAKKVHKRYNKFRLMKEK